ncbi:DUF3048 domain-containing protein [Clostridium sp. D2Q-11]|uniref:DUF3048 domain-containing protein n=1 Tax=Anaeromonas frigoriresistens TaxID=2683708 RepID=A0A942Z7I5_9FIRM|nr:DUF3048 domain-containing protein [Anaeromonas frigoriresistens]MBS4536904.1 DUF3048 domain-containing protein [Anaeromonas frigoriresistens]
MKKILIILFLVIVLVGSVGCNNDEDTNQQEPNNNQSEEEQKDNEENNNNDKDKSSAITSPLSGINTEESKINRRPVAIMFDNHKNARWQSGLSEAEIAYEYLVEGKITRYMGIYLINDPEVIGPLRSARPYYLSSLLEYDAIYAHAGGSPQAKEEIRELGIADVDAIGAAGSVFYRNNDVGKKAPHNLYTSMESIREYAENKDFNKEAEFNSFSFNKEGKDIDGDVAKDISIHYDSDNITSYKYDEELSLYMRYKDGEKHLDEYDNTILTSTNIIIQEAKTQVLDDQGRLQIDIVGKGKGTYITRGKYINITWEKTSRESKTKYYDEDVKEIILNPGITWIQVTPINPKVEIS